MFSWERELRPLSPISPTKVLFACAKLAFFARLYREAEFRLCQKQGLAKQVF